MKVRVFASGRRCWFIRGRVRGAEGSPKFLLLGDYPDMSEHKAELAAANARNLLRQGINPLQQRSEEAIANKVAGMTFGQLAEEYLAKGAGNLREVTLRAP